MTIIGSIYACAIQIVVTAPVDTFALTRVTIGAGGTPYGYLMPYRASNPLYGLIGIYHSPGAVTRTCDCTHLCYAFNEDGVTSVSFGGGTGTANLGGTAGLWSIYSASMTNVLTAGATNVETWGLTIAGVLTNYSTHVMGLSLATLATSFAGPHGVNTQRGFSVGGASVTAINPLVSIQAVSGYTTVPSSDFGSYLASIAADGTGAASGTIRADSLGSASYQMLGALNFQVRFTCGGVYDATAMSFDPTSHPMIAIPLLSLLPA